MMPPNLVEAMPRRPLTMGEANVEEKKVAVAAAREERAETREEREREKSERLLKEKAQGESSLLQQFMSMQEKAQIREAELRDEMLARERKYAEDRRLSDEKWEERIKVLLGDKKPDEVERLVSLANSMHKGGDTAASLEALRAEHTRELARMSEQRDRDRESFTTQLKDARDRADRIASDERARADQRIKDAEERFHNNERDARERAAADVQRAKDEAERRLGEQHRQTESRIADLDRNHARDLASKEAAHVMATDSLKATYEMRIDQARGEVKRTSQDVERYKKEAEDNKDVVGAITKLKENAAALGMIDASEAGGDDPETFGQMAMKVGANLASSLPQIVESISNLVRGGKDAEALAHARALERQHMAEAQGRGFAAPPSARALPAPHQRRQAPPQLQPLSQVTSPPLIPGQEPFRHSPRTNTIREIPMGDQQPEEIMRQEALARQQQSQIALERPLATEAPFVPGPGVDPFHTGMPPEPQMAPPPPAPSAAPAPALGSAPPPAPAPAVDAGLEALLAEDREIIQTEPWLVPQYTASVSPALLAAGLIDQAGPDTVRQMLAGLGSAERVIEAYERQRGPEHPFVRRDGKKFLRALFAELRELVK